MPRFPLAAALLLGAVCAFPQTAPPSVGAGSTAAVQTAFQTAYLRNGFNTLVGAPTGMVAPFLVNGLIQTFPGATNRNATYALIKPDATDTLNVVQVYADMFGYYGYLGYSAAGFPTI